MHDYKNHSHENSSTNPNEFIGKKKRKHNKFRIGIEGPFDEDPGRRRGGGFWCGRGLGVHRAVKREKNRVIAVLQDENLIEGGSQWKPWRD